MPFSSGQDSFSKFTMDLVRQYMKEEEVRAQHQSSLLRLRQKALREKTKTELAWLEHQKRQDKCYELTLRMLKQILTQFPFLIITLVSLSAIHTHYKKKGLFT